MKVGIVTVYKNVNYGSKLQSYALQYTLRKIGVDIAENLLVHKDSQSQLDTNNAILKYCNLLLRVFKNPCLVYNRFFNRSVYKEIKNRSNIFSLYLKEYISESKHSPLEIEKRLNNGIQDYSYFICGSDQIWAPNQFNEAYFLSFVKDKKIKISYATSIGLPVIPDNLIPEYKRLISNIGHISIREQDGADIVKKITGLDVPVVLDPTLLLTRDEWLEHSSEFQIDGDYILCLFLGENKQYRRWVERFNKKQNYKIITLPMKSIDYKFGDNQYFNVGPKEFISLLANASVVCTDSYHGMLFSINFNKNFYGFLRFEENHPLNQNSRVINFLSSLNLTDRIINNENILANNDNSLSINWKEVNDLIEKKRDFSIDFLKRSLNV